jgi:hypothetical protein
MKQKSRRFFKRPAIFLKVQNSGKLAGVLIPAY